MLRRRHTTAFDKVLAKFMELHTPTTTLLVSAAITTSFNPSKPNHQSDQIFATNQKIKNSDKN